MGFSGHPSVDVSSVIDKVCSNILHDELSFKRCDIPKKETIDRYIVDNNVESMILALHKCKLWENEEEFNNYQRMVIGINFLKQINLDGQ